MSPRILTGWTRRAPGLCASEPTPFLSATVSRTVLPAGEHAEVAITFSPPAAEKYEAQLPFIINGLSSTLVPVRGEGCELRLELADATRDQQVKLGPIRPQQQQSRSVSIVNRSRRPVDVSHAIAGVNQGRSHAFVKAK